MSGGRPVSRVQPCPSVLHTLLHRCPSSQARGGRDPALHRRWPAGLLPTPAACPCLCVDDAQTHTHTCCAGRLPQLPRSPAWSKHRPPACASHSNHPIHLQCTGPPGFWLPTPVRSGQSPGGSKSCSDVVSSSDPQGITLTDALSWCHFSSRF